MPALKVTATIGQNIFTVEGDFTFDDTFQRAFVNLILQTTAPRSDQATIDRLTHDTTEINQSADAIGDMAHQLGTVAPDAPPT